MEGVEVTGGAITAEEYRLGVAILDREATIVKFNGNRIITSKSAY